MGSKFLNHALDVFLLGIAIALTKAAAAQVDHDPHVQFVHFSAKLLDFFLGDAALMAVDINEWKFGSRDRMLRHL